MLSLILNIITVISVDNIILILKDGILPSFFVEYVINAQKVLYKLNILCYYIHRDSNISIITIVGGQKYEDYNCR